MDALVSVVLPSISLVIFYCLSTVSDVCRRFCCESTIVKRKVAIEAKNSKILGFQKIFLVDLCRFTKPPGNYFAGCDVAQIVRILLHHDGALIQEHCSVVGFTIRIA